MGPSVLVAVGPADFEPTLLARLADSGADVVRRCVDVADLLGVAASRQATVALVSLQLRGIDADTLHTLGELEVLAVGVCTAGDDSDQRTLRRLGCRAVLTPEEVSELEDVVARARRQTRTPLEDEPGPPAAEPTPGRGRLFAVWGPTGAPGRSTVATGLAGEIAAVGTDALLVDADVYGGSCAQLLGILDESSGLLAATRSANLGSLDAAMLARHARQVGDRLRVLTGLPRADRWPEVRPALVRNLIETGRELADAVVVDCGFSLELDEELSYDTAAPRRNGATLELLELADVVVVVGAADPVGLGRLIRGLDELAQTSVLGTRYVVVNRMRPSLGWSAEEVAATVHRATGATVRQVLPDDPSACDQAVVQGRMVGEAAPNSKLARQLRVLAADLLGTGQPVDRRVSFVRRRTATRAR
jgi:MinD-like ATPase involved in chromosome partitioning or flagellar assembly